MVLLSFLPKQRLNELRGKLIILMDTTNVYLSFIKNVLMNDGILTVKKQNEIHSNKNKNRILIMINSYLNFHASISSFLNTDAFYYAE